MNIIPIRQDSFFSAFAVSGNSIITIILASTIFYRKTKLNQLGEVTSDCFSINFQFPLFLSSSVSAVAKPVILVRVLSQDIKNIEYYHFLGCISVMVAHLPHIRLVYIIHYFYGKSKHLAKVDIHIKGIRMIWLYSIIIQLFIGFSSTFVGYFLNVLVTWFSLLYI